MALRVRGFDWNTSSLGTPDTWPAALRTMVRMMLLTRHPAFIFWGREHVCLYNDAYAASLGPEKHPSILGLPAKLAWAEIWHIIGPQIDQVLRGEGATWHENQLVPIIRHGGLQDVYWTYSFGPIHDETADNSIGGVLVLCTETTKQVEAEKRFATENQQLSRLFEQAPTFMTLLTGPEHVFELANPAYLRVIGNREVVGKRVVDVLPEAVGQGFVGLLDDVYATGKPYVGSAVPYSSSAESGQRFLDFIYQPVTDGQGKVASIFVVGSDVTERMRAQDALVESEEQLRLAIEAAEVGLWDVDPINDRLFWPERVKNMFGIHSGRAVSMADFYAGLHPEDRAAVTAAFSAAVDPNQRALYDVEYRTIGREDALVRWVAAKGRGIFNSDRCLRVLGTALDITKRKRDEERIRELNDTLGQRVTEYLSERKLFADLVDGTDAFVQVSDLNFRWLAINRASADEFERIFGRRPEVGASMLDVLADLPEQQSAVKQVWQRALNGEEFSEVQVFGDESLVRRSYEMHFRPLHDSHGERIGAYQFVYDVTERLEKEQRLAQAEAALHQAQKMEAVGQLTGGLAHDFNNLLQAIHSNFELLRRKPGDAELTSKLAEKGLQTARRAAKVTGQLLTFSRLQSLDIRPIALATVLHGMEDLLRSTVGSQVTLKLQPVDETLWVHADAAQLEMAVLNLGINARDAMPAGGQLRVFISKVTNDFVDLAVEDTGLGMSKEVASRAFDPFFTTKEIGKGSGLGLSQVYAMASRAKGSARIESEPGVGTTVVLSLRRTEPELDPELLRGDGQPVRQGLKGRILVIDDDLEVRQGLVETLESLGHEVLQADGGEQGLKLLEDEVVDAVLMDFAMPGLNGAQTALRARSRQPELSVIFMSGYSDMDAIAAAVGPGAPLLRKPFDMQTVHVAVQQAIQLRREADAA